MRIDIRRYCPVTGKELFNPWYIIPFLYVAKVWSRVWSVLYRT